MQTIYIARWTGGPKTAVSEDLLLLDHAVDDILVDDLLRDMNFADAELDVHEPHRAGADHRADPVVEILDAVLAILRKYLAITLNPAKSSFSLMIVNELSGDVSYESGLAMCDGVSRNRSSRCKSASSSNGEGKITSMNGVLLACRSETKKSPRLMWISQVSSSLYSLLISSPSSWMKPRDLSKDRLRHALTAAGRRPPLPAHRRWASGGCRC